VRSSIEFWFWRVSIPCAAIANVLAFWVFARLKSVGYKRRWWKMEDFKLYETYWRIAPEHSWSRLPLIAAVGIFLLGVAALLLPH
jgi:hypothetical protein